MKKKKFKRIYFTTIFIVALFIGIGYSFLTNTLNVFGNAHLGANKWDIHFDNLVITEGSVVTGSMAKINDNKTVVDFSSVLSKPGDFYEFTINVVNGGTIDARLNSIINAGLGQSEERYLSYDVAYANGDSIKDGDILKKGEVNTVRVRIRFRRDITAEDLPTQNSSLNLSFSLNYVQA